MRWSLDLLSPAVVAAGAGSHAEPALHLGPDKDGRRAEVTIRAEANALEIEVLAFGVDAPAAPPPYPEWYLRAHVVVFLNPGHDHATRWMFAVADNGEIIRQADWALPGEEPGDVHSRKREVNLPAWQAVIPVEGKFERLEGSRFRARLHIAMGLGSTARAAHIPTGFSIKVGFHDSIIVQALQWPARVEWSKDLPLVFGDLYVSPPGLHVERLEIPEPAWSPATSQVVVHGRRSTNGPREGRARVAIRLPGEKDLPTFTYPWKAEGETVRLNLPVQFPARAKWASDVESIARLGITLEDQNGERWWDAEYPFGFDAGIIVRERYGPQSRALPDRPKPDDPEFTDRFRAYVLARIPDYRARTTREGAPSDFFLEDPAGDASLDLSAAGALDRVADLLVQRFPEWQDALFAAAAWVFHPLITRHSGSWSRVASQATVETVLRMGGCLCCDAARLTAAVAEKIGARKNVVCKAYALGLRGHICTLVATPEGRVVLDGMLGLGFHTLDHTRLATLEELRADARIAESAWYYPRAHGHEFFFGVHDQNIRDWEEGALEWPATSG